MRRKKRFTPPAKITKRGTDNDTSILEYQIRKRIFKTKPSDSDQIARVSRRSTLSNQEYEQWWYDSWFTDEFSEESSELSNEPEESIRNLTSLNEIFQIVPCQMDRNFFFHTLKILAYGGKYSSEEIRNEICAIMIKKEAFIKGCLRRRFWHSYNKHKKKWILRN